MLTFVLEGLSRALAPLLGRLLLRLALRMLLLFAFVAVVGAIGFRLSPARLRERIASVPAALSLRMRQRLPEG